MGRLASVIAAALVLVPTFAIAQGAAYPTRAVKVLVPVPPGGTPDLLARILSQKLSQRLGQQFVVENRSGAGGNIAAEATARAPADGHTLFFPPNAVLTLNPAVYAKLGFDPLKDFAPISVMGRGGYYFLACPSVPANTVQELVALARARPGGVTYATGGHGTSHHLAGEILNTMANVRLTHVPYKGFGQGVADAISCKVDLIVGSVGGGLPYIKSGRLKALAVTSAARFRGTPEVQTMIEAGFPGFEVEAYYGLVAPAGTPRPIVDRLHAEMLQILREKDVLDKLAEQGLEPGGNTPEDYSARLRAELQKSILLAQSLNLRVD
jgi:tripartite-type tricarboxylate transporter receptor subunit TctC